MPRLDKLAFSLAAALLVAPEALWAQEPGAEEGGAASVWTFSTDSSNNLVIQDLASLRAAPATGQTLCLQWMPLCPDDVPRPRRRYSIRNLREKNTEWRLEVSEPTFSTDSMTLPLEVGVGETGMVQVVSGEGPWSVDLRRIPANELRAGDGKKWKVDVSLSSPNATSNGCWVEVQCPGGS
jgi:hypothetical protein